MADVKKIDIDGVQWDMKDEVARNRINELEQKTDIMTERIWEKDNSFIDKVKINNEYFVQVHFEHFRYKGEAVEDIITLQKPLGNSRTLRAQMLGDVIYQINRISIDLDFTEKGIVSAVILNQNIYMGGNFEIEIYGDAFLKIV